MHSPGMVNNLVLLKAREAGGARETNGGTLSPRGPLSHRAKFLHTRLILRCPRTTDHTVGAKGVIL